MRRFFMLKALVAAIVVELCCPSLKLPAITLSQKREQLATSEAATASSKELQSLHETLVQKQGQLRSLYDEMQNVLCIDFKADTPLTPEQLAAADEYRTKITALTKEIRALEEEWKQVCADESEEEIEGLWHQPDSTVGQLVIDYSCGDAVYVVPPDIAGYKIHLSSKLSVPRAAWGEMLEVILSNLGIGIKQLTPFVRQLYFVRLNQSGLRCITDDRTVLDALLPGDRIAFLCSPPSGELRRILQFLEKFAPQDELAVQMVGGHLVLVGNVREVRDLMKVYDFIAAPKRAQEYRIVTLQRADSEEVAKILTCIFEGEMTKAGEGGSAPAPVMIPQDASFGFRVIPLKFPASSLFFIGKHEQIEKACKIVQDLEVSIGEVQEKTIHWYACRHSEAEDLAKVLSQVYTKMMGLNPQSGPKGGASPAKSSDPLSRLQEKIQAREHAEDNLIVNVPPVGLSPEKGSGPQTVSENFIVDPKTNSIIMVVENYVFPKLKELLHKLDVPKRMVQIDVLLFEKKVSDSSSMGLSSLKMGDMARNKNKKGVMWTDIMPTERRKEKRHHGHHKDGHDDDKQAKGAGVEGILEFVLSQRKHGGFPAYDLAYQFLLTQEDIQINANPTVTTVNQTPAKIAVVDQISINTGAVEFDRDHFKDSYSRAEYGITIQITPTVHAKIDEETGDEPKFVTLATDIVFDSTRPDRHERPDVTRRNVKNEVRVQDGETVILGGLRRKLSSGQQQMIPFLGELPGVGKLFSMSSLSDSNTEMFIFLTPRILPDDHEQWKEARRQELSKRPGDIPEFLEEVMAARKERKSMIMEKSLRMLFGKPDMSL
jgi:general secretion pathway protein D